MEHSMLCFARLVRLLLGPSAVAANKLEFGRKLCILGVDVALAATGVTMRPSPDKVQKWQWSISKAIETKHLSRGDASKLAGRLAWGGSHLFRKIGRAMLRPIFDQTERRRGTVAAELLRALAWWSEVLSAELCEKRPWLEPGGEIAHLFL